MYKQLAFDPMADLAPIALIAESQTVLVVNPSLPVKNVAELIALAKVETGTVEFRIDRHRGLESSGRGIVQQRGWRPHDPYSVQGHRSRAHGPRSGARFR